MPDIAMIFPHLNSTLSNTSERIAFFFGAGISVSLAGKGYSWGTWVRDGIALLPNPSRREVYSASLGDVPGKKGNPTADTLVAVLEELISELKGLPGVYEEWMHQAFETSDVQNGDLAAALKKMLLFQDFFVTTNYDSLLSQATGVKAASYLRPELVYPMLDERRNDFIIHIHGRYSTEPHDSEDSIIATETQYREILENQGAQFIQNVIGTNTVIFIGCGKTTSDKNISRFLTFAKDHLNLEKTYYFLYKAGQEPEDLPDNVEPVCYGNDYCDLLPFLESMAEIRADAFVKAYDFIELLPAAITADKRQTFSSFYFAAESLSFRGRKDEIAEIGRFLSQADPFRWYAITGQSGSGKSRLALEICHRYASSWCAFFIKPYCSAASLDKFIPYRNTLVIIDDFKGLERNVAALIEKAAAKFAGVPYKLRILLCERENDAKSGTWFAELERSFPAGYLPEFRASQYGGSGKPFLVLGDLEDAELEGMIGEICAGKGLPADPRRDRILRESYQAKLEILHYRPLFLQMYVESWIDNGCSTTRFDNSEGLLEDILKREQDRWLKELGGSYELFNAWTHLLLLSAVAGRLTRSAIPAKYQPDFEAILSYVKSHSFPGKQRQERFISLVSDMCHSIGHDDAYIEVMYPDVIKEFCFLYYLDEDNVIPFSRDLWEFEPKSFSRLLIKIFGDFPYHDKAYAAVDGDESYRVHRDALFARTHLLDNSILQSGDDLERIHRWVDREYDFWHRLAEANDGSDDTETFLTVLGLDKVAQQYGAQDASWNPTVDKMLRVFDEVLALKGGEAVEMIQMVRAQDTARRLSVAGYGDQAEKLLEKVNSIMRSEFGKELAEEVVLEQYNTKIMTLIIFEEDFFQAYEILKKALVQAKKCNSAASLAYFLGTCYRFGQLAVEAEKEKYIRRAETIAAETNGMFDDDENIICVRLLIRMNRINFEILCQDKKGQKQEVLEIISTALSSSGKYSNECLGIAGITLLNLTNDEEEIETLQRRIRERLESITDTVDNGGEELAQACLRFSQALKELRNTAKFSKLDIEDAYSLMLRFPESETIRGIFMAMLEESEEAGNRDHYMRREVVTAAVSDARYNPLHFSGIEEIDALHSFDSFLPEEPYRRPYKKVGANDPCPCGSGKKFKKCCRGNGKYD